MVRELAEIALNPKVAVSVSAAATGIGASATWIDFADKLLPMASVFVGLLVSVVVIIVQLSDLLRKNREHKAAMVKSELEIEILRQKTKVLDEIDRLSND